MMVIRPEDGWYYIVQTVPDLAPHRLKFGYSTKLLKRLKSYRTGSPTAVLLRCWRCRSDMEHSTTRALTAVDCRPVGASVESFDVDDVEDVLYRAELLLGTPADPNVWLTPLPSVPEMVFRRAVARMDALR